ncbi:MAG: heavy-metal-associated domain-containing protein [Flavobacteriaceae bacterium]
MKQQFSIEGMTCGSCAQHIQTALETLPGVSDVAVSHKEGTARFESKTTITHAEVAEVLPSKYALVSDTAATPSKVRQLFPLFLIFGYLVVATFLLHKDSFVINRALPDFMGLFFIVFSFFKFLDLKGFQQSFRMYDPLARSVSLYGWAYPFLELALGLMFLMRLELDVALWTTLAVLSITTFGVTKTLINKKQIQCACLGSALNLPMTEATFIENAIMIVMALFMLL